MHDSQQDFAQVSVSVIIPAHNEENFIVNCITSVWRTDWHRDQLEILVVDHQSTDTTASLSRRAGAHVLHQTRDKKIGAVRNAGLMAAKGRFVAYVDADCTVPHKWLRSAIALLESDEKIGAVGGPCLSPQSGTWVERCLAPSRITLGTRKEVVALATSSLITRTELLHDLGQFNENVNSGEDDDVSNKIRRLGLSLISASDCHIVHHGYPRTLSAVLRKEIWHGSHHIEVRSGFDPTLILAFVFIFASAAIPILLIFALLKPSEDTLGAFIGAVALQLAPPLLYALKRIRQSLEDWHLGLAMFVVGYFYFLGHGIGVLANLGRRVTVARRGYVRPNP